MSKLSLAFWKSAKHSLTAGLSAALAAHLAGGAQPKQIAMSFVFGALAGLGINARAIQKA